MAIFGRVMISEKDRINNEIHSSSDELLPNYLIGGSLVLILVAIIATNAFVINYCSRKNNIASKLMMYKAVWDVLYGFILSIKILLELLTMEDPTQRFPVYTPYHPYSPSPYVIYLYRHVDSGDVLLAALTYVCQSILVINSFYLVLTRTIKIKLPFYCFNKNKLYISFYTISLLVTTKFIVTSLFASISTHSFSVTRLLYRFSLFIVMYPTKYDSLINDKNASKKMVDKAFSEAYRHYIIDMMISRTILSLLCILNIIAIIYSIYLLKRLTNSVNKEKMKRSTHHIILLAVFDVIFVLACLIWYVQFLANMKNLQHIDNAKDALFNFVLCYGPFMLFCYDLLIRALNPTLFIVINKECRSRVSGRLTDIRNSFQQSTF